ncbi:MAG: protease family protein [Mycobacterium sp.]|jgi:membrane protease YdiL (CAAX protease family)|nr:protease family protein [Mycobacterium sp.]
MFATMIRRSQALSLAAGLVAWSLLPVRRGPVIQAALATGLAVLTEAPLGLRPPALWTGLRMGAAAGATVVLGVAGSTALPSVRRAMAERTPPAAPVAWLVFQIPVGTVWSEEIAYRGALATLAAAGFGRRQGRLVQAAAFGLSHIADARATGEPVIGTVLVTGAAGWVFALLAERSGSVTAAMLAHLAVNEAGAAAALAVQSRRGGVHGH